MHGFGLSLFIGGKEKRKKLSTWNDISNPKHPENSYILLSFMLPSNIYAKEIGLLFWAQLDRTSKLPSMDQRIPLFNEFPIISFFKSQSLRF